MGGFGDGMAFGPWIEDHIRRKAATGAGDALEQASAGAAACLRSGVTTIADCSYSGAVADAAAEAGLRAIVYVEGFSDWPDLRSRTEARHRRPHDHRPRAARRVAARPLHGDARRLPDAGRAGPRARAADRHAPARVGPRDDAPRRVPRRPGRRHGRDPRRLRRSRRHRAHGGPRRAGRPLPALERAARLRDRPAPGAARGRHPRRARDGLPVVGDRLRHVGRDARRGHARPGAPRPGGCDLGPGRARARNDGRGRGARPGRRRPARSRPARRPTSACSTSPARASCRGTIRSRPPSTAAHAIASP